MIVIPRSEATRNLPRMRDVVADMRRRSLAFARDDKYFLVLTSVFQRVDERRFVGVFKVAAGRQAAGKTSDFCV